MIVRASFALLLLFATACEEGLPPPPQAGPSATPGVGSLAPAERPTGCEDISAADAGPGLVVQVNFSFAPACFAISSTQALQVGNQGTVTHNFSIADAVDVDVEPDERETLDAFQELTGPGTFDFFCKFHKGRGMVGIVIVE